MKYHEWLRGRGELKAEEVRENKINPLLFEVFLENGYWRNFENLIWDNMEYGKFYEYRFYNGIDDFISVGIQRKQYFSETTFDSDPRKGLSFHFSCLPNWFDLLHADCVYITFTFTLQYIEKNYTLINYSFIKKMEQPSPYHLFGNIFILKKVIYILIKQLF